jgi:glycosyltransferase involved in cell wall biosynthesis
MKKSEIQSGNLIKQSFYINPLVSVITVVYNGDLYLDLAIRSVLAQTYNNLEYLIIDGGSTDTSIDKIKSYEKQFHDKKIDYKWISEPDKGISDAFNKGIRLASGELIGIINSDDWLEPDAVENIVQSLDNKYSIYCGTLKIYDTKLNLLKIRKSRPSLLPLGMYVNHPTVFVKKEVYLNNKYDTDLKISMDYDILLRFQKKGYKIKAIDKQISNMRGGGISWNIEKMRAEQKLVMKRNMSLISYFIARIKLNAEEIAVPLFKRWKLLK